MFGKEGIKMFGKEGIKKIKKTVKRREQGVGIPSSSFL